MSDYPKYLRNTETGVVFCWTPELAKEPQMVGHDEAPSNDPPAPPSVPAADSSNAGNAGGSVIEDEDKPARIEAAIGNLEDSDFNAAGKPSVPALSNLLDEPVSAAERDQAWERYQAAHAADEG